MEVLRPKLLIRIFFIPLLLKLIAVPLAFSQERFETYSGIRQLGMGGVAVATVNDETSLLLNPSGLGRIRGPIATLVDVELTIGGDNLAVVDGLTPGAWIDSDGVYDLAVATQDKKWHLKAQTFPSFVTTNFGFGVLAKYEINGEVRTDTGEYRLSYFEDYIPTLGYNLSFFGGIMKLGFVGKYIDRTEIRGDFAIAGDYSISNIGRNGTAFGADVGMQLTSPTSYLPTLALVWRDVGNTQFQDGGFNGVNNGPPTTITQTLDVGLAISPILGKRTRSVFSLEYRDAFTFAEAQNQIKRLHFGFEINVDDFVFIRAGANQGYWTAGGEFAMENFQFQIASYGEEVGSGSSKEEDRRYVGKLVIRF